MDGKLKIKKPDVGLGRQLRYVADFFPSFSRFYSEYKAK